MLIGITTIPKDSGVDMKAVIDLTEDKRWQVGLTAIEALNKAGDPAVEGKLIEICSSERNRYDITAAMRNLNLIGTPRAIPTLETLLKSRSRNIRGVAEAAIDAIRNRESDGKT
jgi:HEAT repeat protein